MIPLFSSCVSSESMFASKFGWKRTLFVRIMDSPLRFKCIEKCTKEDGVEIFWADYLCWIENYILIGWIEDVSEVNFRFRVILLGVKSKDLRSLLLVVVFRVVIFFVIEFGIWVLFVLFNSLSCLFGVHVSKFIYVFV